LRFFFFFGAPCHYLAGATGHASEIESWRGWAAPMSWRGGRPRKLKSGSARSPSLFASQALFFRLGLGRAGRREFNLNLRTTPTPGGGSAAPKYLPGELHMALGPLCLPTTCWMETAADSLAPSQSAHSSYWSGERALSLYW